MKLLTAVAAIASVAADVTHLDGHQIGGKGCVAGRALSYATDDKGRQTKDVKHRWNQKDAVYPYTVKYTMTLKSVSFPPQFAPVKNNGGSFKVNSVDVEHCFDLNKAFSPSLLKTKDWIIYVDMQSSVRAPNVDEYDYKVEPKYFDQKYNPAMSASAEGEDAEEGAYIIN